ncbi:MAG: hypothetical protein HRU69_07340 [Flammeovirgaceae bacterium]|nr:MAG: hypothetical protein HRU69_07340 [Flammeovirgaceae bacterium]
MIKANPQLLIALAIYFNSCSYAQEQQKISYDIRINYSEKRRVETRSSFKDKEVSKKLEDDIHLFFETGFLKDKITLIINNEVIINKTISTDEALGLAEYINVGKKKEVKNLGIRLNNGSLAYIEIKPTDNVIGVYLVDRKLLVVEFIEGYPSYY